MNQPISSAEKILRAANSRKLGGWAALGLFVAIGLYSTGLWKRILQVPGRQWFFIQQSWPGLVVFDILLIFIAAYSLAGLTDLSRRIRRTHLLPSRPTTLVHGLFVAVGAFAVAICLLSPEHAAAVLLKMLAPSTMPASHLPVWTLICLAIAARPERKKHRSEPAQIVKPAMNVGEALVDDPITKDSEDILGRGWFVEKLYKQIKSLPTPCNRFVLAIDGPWGDGKTSVLNLLERTLSEDATLMSVRFNPWLFDDDRSAIRGFFRALDEAITERFFYPSLSSIVGKYSKAFGDSRRGLIESLIGGDSSDGFEVTKREVGEAIRTLEMRIVIFVDDVDRLEYRQLIGIFRLVNLLADFPNIIFVLSLDRIQVAKTLDVNKRDEAFLEKIIQRREPLPRIAQAVLDDFVDKGLEALLDSVKATTEERVEIEKRVGYLYQKNLKGLFPNLRAAKQFLNGAWAHIPPLRAEVDLADLILLEIIYSCFPTLYADLWPGRWHYVNPAWSRAKRDLVASLVGSSEQEKNLKEAKIHIEGLTSGFAQRQTALELLKAIFPEVQNALTAIGRHTGSERSMREARRLCHPDCLRKAFEQTIQEGELSDARIGTLQERWKGLSGEKLLDSMRVDLEGLQAERLLPDFIERMIDRIEKIPSELVAPLIRSIAAISAKLSSQETVPFSSEIRQARNLALLLMPKLSPDEIKLVIEELLSTPSGMDFSVGIMFFVLKDRDREPGFESVYSSLDRQKAINVFVSRVTSEYLDGKKDVFQDSEVKSPTLLLNCWANLCGKRDDVRRYLDEVVAISPDSIVALIRPFYRGNAWPFEFGSLSNVFDAAQIARLANSARPQVDDRDKAIVLDTFLKVYEQQENQQTEEVLKQLTPFEQAFLRSFNGVAWQRLDNANGLHIQRLMDQGFVERVPFTAEFLVDPRKQFGVRLTPKGKKLSERIPQDAPRVESANDPISEEMESRKKAFQAVRAQMPELIAEIKDDLSGNSFVREFIVLPHKNVTYNGDTSGLFTYFEDKHPSLPSKIQILENRGFIKDVATNNVSRYRMTEEFVEVLLSE